jgi:predicted transposase/invertase (TIGR01784 family)
MGEGDRFRKLKPVISIWVLNGILFGDVKEYHLPFAIYNLKRQLLMTDHLAIHLIQLPLWKFDGKIINEKERWLYLFQNGENIDTDKLPKILNTPEMRQVMEVIQQFSESRKNYLLYQSRLEANLLENTYLYEIEEALKAKKKALKEKEQALKKFEDLQLLLKKKGIDIEELS